MGSIGDSTYFSLQNGKGKPVFLERLFQHLVKASADGKNGTLGLCNYEPPEKLEKLLDLPLTPAPRHSDDELHELCRQAVHYSVNTAHPMYFNQLCQGVDPYGLAACWISDALNTSLYTYESAPAFTLIEMEVLRKVKELVGYSVADADGLFSPGGSFSNMYAINVARYHRFPEIKTRGMRDVPPMCVFTSEQCHYSVDKAVAFLGLGLDNLVKVPCDDRGKMIPAEFRRLVEDAKARGVVPLAVVATAGTTVAGAYDPLPALADVCAEHGVWLHVDMCWGGGALLSATHRHLLAGLERSDSVAWNFHKLLGAPQQCAVFVVKHKGVLSAAHCSNASYLFQPDKCYDVKYDHGDKSIQCGRKADAFKVWLMWKAYGDAGFEARIDHFFNCARYLANKVRNTPGFRLVFNEPECTNVCFWYIPPSLRGQEETPEWWQKIGKVAPAVKAKIMERGSMMMTYCPLGDHVNFFRMVIANHATQIEHMDTCIDEIVNIGQTLVFDVDQ